MQNMTAGAFVDWFPTDSPATNGGLPPWLGSLIICCVVLAYVFFGGMRGTAWANAFQTIVFMILGIVTFCVIAAKLGGRPTLLENLQALGEALPERSSTRVEMSRMKFFTYMLVPFSVGMFPHLFQHWLTARSAESFKLPVVAHPIFIMIVWVPCVLIGVWATTELVSDRPPLPASPNAILPFLVKTQAGPVLGGFLTAGILAAIMSSLDSQFLCLGTMFTKDIVEHYFGADRFSDQRKVTIARLFIVVIVAITYGLSLFRPPSVFALGVWCFSGFSGLFPLVVAALYWRRLTKWGAYACVLAMAGSWGYFFTEALGRAKAAGNPGPIRTYVVELNWGGQTYETMAVVWIFAASLIALVVVSLLTQPPREETVRRFFS